MVGQNHFTRIDRAYAVLVVTELTFNGVFAIVRTSESNKLAVFRDQEADDIGIGHDVAVGLTFTFSLGEVDDARLLRIVSDHEDVVFTNFRHVVVDAAVARVVLMLTVRIAEEAILRIV